MEEGPEDRHKRHVDPQIAGAEQQEGVGRVAEGEDDRGRARNAQKPPAERRLRSSLRGSPPSRGTSRTPKRTAATASAPGIAVSRKTWPQLQATPAEQREGEERTDHRAGMVCRTVEAEGAATDRRLDRVGDERVPRCPANPLADAVGDADRQDLGGRLREADQGPDQRGDPVAHENQRLPAAHPVRQPAARELQESRRGLRRPLDGTDRRVTRTEGCGEKQGEQRVGHVARHVGEEAHRRESEDVAAEPRGWPRIHRHDRRLPRRNGSP